MKPIAIFAARRDREEAARSVEAEARRRETDVLSLDHPVITVADVAFAKALLISGAALDDETRAAWSAWRQGAITGTLDTDNLRRIREVNRCFLDVCRQCPPGAYDEAARRIDEIYSHYRIGLSQWALRQWLRSQLGGIDL